MDSKTNEIKVFIAKGCYVDEKPIISELFKLPLSECNLQDSKSVEKFSVDMLHDVTVEDSNVSALLLSHNNGYHIFKNVELEQSVLLLLVSPNSPREPFFMAEKMEKFKFKIIFVVCGTDHMGYPERFTFLEQFEDYKKKNNDCDYVFVHNFEMEKCICCENYSIKYDNKSYNCTNPNCKELRRVQGSKFSSIKELRDSCIEKTKYPIFCLKCGEFFSFEELDPKFTSDKMVCKCGERYFFYKSQGYKRLKNMIRKKIPKTHHDLLKKILK
jgi:hypothetical protein